MSGLISVVLLLAQMSGGIFIYTVQDGDSLTGVGARFGVETRVLAEANGLKTSSLLQKGQTMQIDNRHIVSPAEGATIVINVPQRMLFYFERDNLAAAYPIAAGKSTWKTPLGNFEIVAMEEHPTWDVPVSIQEEMRRAGKPVVTRVPPSPANPLGDYWMGLSLPGIGLHGTNAPSSIYSLATHGCIRLHPDDVEQLFSNVDAGTPGRIIYQPILFARIENAVFLEVHPDAYKKLQDPLRAAIEIARAASLLDVLDHGAVQEVVRQRDGIPRDVSRR